MDSFGKLKTFTQRLNKILEMFSTISTYSVLQNSNIEGLETMATKFQMEETQVGLQVSLLVRSPETGELFVNFDPQILIQIREELCIKQAQVLNTKSSLVEEAANELINMLMFDDNQKADGGIKEEVENSAECEVRKKKKKDLAEVMEEEAKKLLSYFNHRCVESLLRLTRSNLEMLRKRIEQPSVNHFSEDSISEKTSITQVIPFQARNYYKSVSENKEITKLLSVLSSSISSSKKVHALCFTNFCTIFYSFIFLL
ncbi:unnamed protein product [Tetraodon nigroviridis]|uniref:(spotted green pufferfish) hypothetical protein n=1 Tax=Tetraodon nigroviridis TaxID=99883 RepID=Q4RFK2_TETNG|nr:unnamed protein product [Tetraodon nigroviridis]